jgi:glycosyltransferase involved in cell wall biosynthesis
MAPNGVKEPALRRRHPPAVGRDAATFSIRIIAHADSRGPSRPFLMRRRLIAFLLYDFRASEMVRNVLRIAGAARDAGLEVQLWPIRLQGDMLPEIPDGIRVEPVLVGPARLPRDLDCLRAIPALVRAIDRRAPKVVFSGGNHIHIHAALAIWFAENREAVSFFGRASNAVVSDAPPWALHRLLARPIERFQYESMNRIITVSQELGRTMEDCLRVDGRRLTAISDGVDLALTAKVARSPVSHPFFGEGMPPVILGVGRLSRQKNFEGLIRAFALVRRERAARLVILGAGSARRRQRLLALARRLGVGADVDLPGFVPDPPAYMARAALFVLSSRWEGGSNVLLEALACGCPVVAARAPSGIAEVLRGNAGLLVPVGDERALAKAILTRLSRPRDSLTLRARAAEYDLHRTLGSYVELLCRACR